LLWGDETTTLKAFTNWPFGVLDQVLIVSIVKDVDTVEMLEEVEVWPRMGSRCSLQRSIVRKVLNDMVHSIAIIRQSVIFAIANADEFFLTKCTDKPAWRVVRKMGRAMRDPFFT